jgi:hypothetical protein
MQELLYISGQRTKRGILRNCYAKSIELDMARDLFPSIVGGCAYEAQMLELGKKNQ